jgi:hypothetical protein
MTTHTAETLLLIYARAARLRAPQVIKKEPVAYLCILNSDLAKNAKLV